MQISKLTLKPKLPMLCNINVISMFTIWRLNKKLIIFFFFLHDNGTNEPGKKLYYVRYANKKSLLDIQDRGGNLSKPVQSKGMCTRRNFGCWKFQIVLLSISALKTCQKTRLKRWTRFLMHKLRLLYRSISYREAFSVMKMPQELTLPFFLNYSAHIQNTHVKKYTLSIQTRVFCVIRGVICA